MKIIEINIKTFGRLSDFVLKPAEGVNIIYGDNESGKSTVMSFIKAVFYGFESAEKRSRFEPWEGGKPAGSIEFEHEGITYFLNRSFGETRVYDSISLFDKTHGETVPLSPGQEPGVLVFGINVRTFINSVFIGQSGITVDGDNHEITERLINLSSAGDERISKKEIDKRLKAAASRLDSKKSDAILPELRKQKREFLDSRAAMKKALDEADDLRDQIAVNLREKKTMTEEKVFLEDMLQRLEMKEELAEIDAILRKRDEVAGLEEKFAQLDGIFNGEMADGMSEFMIDSAKLLGEEKLKENALKEKADELDDMRRQAVSIDRQKLAMIKTVKKYNKEISIAFGQYDSLVRERNELELAIAQHDDPEPEPDNTRFVAGICGAVLAAAVILGIAAHWVFYIIGIIAVASIIVYMFIYKKSLDQEDIFSEEELNLSNVNDQISSMSEEYRQILDEFGVRNMDEFDRLYKDIEQNQRKYLEAKGKKDALESQISIINEELEAIRKKLRDNLATYHETESNEEAEEIISKLSSMKQEHEKLSLKLDSARDTYNFMLRGRSIESLILYAEQIRRSVELEVPDSFTKENVKSKIKAVNDKIQQISENIAREETALTLTPYNAQSVQKVTDEIIALNRRIDHYELELAAIEEAQKTLDEAFHEMKIDFGPMINYRSSRVLSGMTGNKSCSVLVSETLVPSFAEQGDSQPRDVGIMGAGTYDQIYLALRLALSGVMTDDKLPVMLDDAFVQFDDERMTGALNFIKQDNAIGEIGQVIIFTCHKRMIAAAKKLEMTENVFSM